MEKLKETVSSKPYIRLANIMGISVLILGLIQKNGLFIFIGFSLLFIQLIKSYSIAKSKTKEPEIPGEEAKGQWR